jgi:hypothetical protein
MQGGIVFPMMGRRCHHGGRGHGEGATGCVRILSPSSATADGITGNDDALHPYQGHFFSASARTSAALTSAALTSATVRRIGGAEGRSA